MISRFNIIKGIGRFQDCQNLGGRQFTDKTIIFGQNTEGKSTLTDILWSFKTGDPAIIEGRKSFGFMGSQQVLLFDQDNNAFRFPSSEWNKGFDKIEIFDTKYINENIFVDNEISFDHQKNLQRIIIGNNGKKLAEEINLLQEEFNELTKKKASKTIEFNQNFKKDILIDDFKKLPKHDDVNENIKQLQSTIETANNQNKIKTVFDNIYTIIDDIYNQKTKNVLSESIQAKVELVSAHILKTWKDPSHPKDFLQTGLTLTKEDKKYCVFCGQRLDEAKDLLHAYSQLFSIEYNKLQANISSAVSKYEKWDPISTYESIQDKLGSINLAINANEIEKIELKEINESINSEFSIKAKDIGYNVNFENYDKLIQIFQQIKMQVDNLKNVNVFNTEVNIDKLKSDIKDLEFSKIRHTQEWNDFLKEYDDIDIIQEEKRVKREALRKELNAHSEKIFSIHFETINKTLEQLNADFSICDFKPIKRLTGQNERIFALKFFKKHSVLIGETATDKPNFKNTLSYSDKRILAFSFFFSLIIHDDKLDEKIIVFDDPVSSFDSDRRTKTIELLANLNYSTLNGELIKKKMNQLIILTHEKDFFAWLFIKLGGPKALKIIGDGLDSNGIKTSTIEDCDVYKEFIEHENKKDLREIQLAYQSNKPIENFEALCLKCRKILESIFTRKYLFELQTIIDKKGSIRSFTVKLKELAINDFDKASKYNNFIDLCDNLNIELHDNTMSNDGGNTLIVLRDFLNLIKQI